MRNKKTGAVVSTIAVALAIGSFASRAQAQESSASAGDLVVTGSRIVKNGYQAPTPVTVLGIEEIQKTAPSNLADSINQLPALAGSTRMVTGNMSGGVNGVNSLNLRNLGPTRTLVLFDGQRMPTAVASGLVDVNGIPNALIARVDIVTGGASAAWGSDAVAGVVNFVLNKGFTGVRAEASAGITTYGDDANTNFSIAGGRGFANGRGHILLNAEYAWNEGLKGGTRSWYTGAKQLFNPAYTATNGLPQLLVRQNVGYTTVAPGAIVTAGPLRGLYFGEGGVPLQLNYGSIVNDPFMVGGDWRVTDFGNGPQYYDNTLARIGAFGRVSYELTDALEVYGQFSFTSTKGNLLSTPRFDFGGLTIQRDNPFLPASVVARMQTAGVTSLTVGSWNEAIGGIPYDSDRYLYRYTVGGSGHFGALGSDWLWDAYYTRNQSDYWQHAHMPQTANYRLALDAVVGPNGQIMCRSTLTNPTNGCSPLNILGTGVASQAGLDYVNGEAWLDAYTKQDIVAATLRGEPLSTWAGPISIATGVEHRKEEQGGVSDPLSMASGYWAGNFKPSIGSYEVTEGFLEVAVPLAADLPWAQSLDLNGAVRQTHYSTSGDVTTWKVGLTYAPIDDIRFRFTRSRDIRAGNITDLFSNGQTVTANAADPQQNNLSYTILQTTIGNPNVKPERANTINAGFVLQPRFIPGLTASVDYWDIKLEDAISTLAVADVINLCYAGDTSLCQYVLRNSSGNITEVLRKPINMAEQNVRGLDLEASYRIGIGDNAGLSLRALATHYLENESKSGVAGTVPTTTLGEVGGTPDWRYSLQATFDRDPFSVTLTARGMSDGVIDADWTECATACPVSTAVNRTIDNNHVDGFLYYDLGASFKIRPEIETFFVVNNVANTAPEPVANGTSVGSQQFGVSALYYDIIGRSYRAGLRLKY